MYFVDFEIATTARGTVKDRRTVLQTAVIIQQDVVFVVNFLLKSFQLCPSPFSSLSSSWFDAFVKRRQRKAKVFKGDFL